MKTRKVTLFSPDLDGGGAERITLYIANYLAKKGVEVNLILGQAKGPYLALLDSEIKLIDLNLSDKHVTLKSLFKLIKHINKEKPDVVFSTLFRANIILSLAKKISKHKPRVVLRHPNMLFPNRKGKESIKGWAIKRMAIKAAEHSDATIVTSRAMNEELYKHISKAVRSKIRIIPNPVPIEEIRKKSKHPIEHSLFFNSDIPTILAVGRFVEQKNFEMLIKAFSMVSKRKNAQLLILGEGPLRAELENLIFQLGLSNTVHLPGFVDNPYAYMGRSSLFVLSSKWEGFPNVLVEAIACGLPVISTNCSGGSREILENGKWGKLVPVNDKDALAEAMLDSLKEKNYPAVENRAFSFSMENILGKYIELFFPSKNN